LQNLKKILKRMDLGCSYCYTKDVQCDTHHIEGHDIPNPDSVENLSYLCPNCHRAAHEGKISIEALKNLEEYVANDWGKLYR